MNQSNGIDLEDGDWTALFATLNGVSPHLEELEFLYGYSDDCYKDLEFLGEANPVSTLSHFSKLQDMTIAQEALLGPAYEQGPGGVAGDDLLPDSLRNLRIWYPSKTIFKWFQSLLWQKPSALENIELITSTDRGEAPEDLSEMVETEEVVKELARTGIMVTVVVGDVHARLMELGLESS
jgi:hypothetical protein